MIFATWNAHQPMAMAQILVSEANLLRSEQDRDFSGLQVFPDDVPAYLQPFERVMQVPLSDRSGSHYQGAVGDRFSNVLVLLRTGEYSRGADGRTSSSIGWLPWVHHSQT